MQRINNNLKIETVVAEVTSNIPQGDVSQMTVDDEGMEHIMKLLTNLYQNPQLAVIREYYTNGLDAHVAAGQTKPVEVSLPSWDSPNYVVKDFGIGMSRDDIKNIYAKYGKSTKRNTNDQVGAFGLGCKSALAITQQFTVVTIKDGWKTTVLFTKAKNGVADVNIVNHSETTEENGTTVKIPIDGSTYSFNQEARNFFKFSDPGLVLVDGVAPESAFENMTEVISPSDPDLKAYLRVMQGYGRAESYVVMGNVPYVLAESEVTESLKRLNASSSVDYSRIVKYFPVNIGDVSLTPGREGLLFDDMTNDVLDKYMKFLIEDIDKIAKTEADKVTDLKEFWTVQAKWKPIVGRELKWNDKQVPKNLKLEKDFRKITRSSWGNAKHSISSTLSLDPQNEILLVKGFSADKYGKLNAYIGPYMTHEGESSMIFLICDDPNLFTNEWVLKSSMFKIVDGEDIITKGRAQRKKEREEAKLLNTPKKELMKYPVLDIDNYEIKWIAYDIIPEDTPYLSKSEAYGTNVGDFIDYAYANMNYDRSVTNSYRKSVVDDLKNITGLTSVILLNHARTAEALKRRVKKTYSVRDLFKQANDKLATEVSEDVELAIGLEASDLVSSLKALGLSSAKRIEEIKDEKLRSTLSPSLETMKNADKVKKTLKGLRSFNFGSLTVSIDPSKKASKVTDSFKTKYALIQSMTTYNSRTETPEHLVMYLNTVHEVTEKKTLEEAMKGN
jgi:Histidine kinase-, DNA gyrase B-, and HSP90-like ATPase